MILVTGSSGHLGEALVRTLRKNGREVLGIDIVPSEFTSELGSIVDRHFVKRCMKGVDAVLHTATLHKPHVVTHSRQSFVDTNVTGTLNLLEEASVAGVGSFVFTSRSGTHRSTEEQATVRGAADSRAGGATSADADREVWSRRRENFRRRKCNCSTLSPSSVK
jgi:nucleoside-diphosphate-sugar epimerase